MFENFAEKRIAREADKIISLKEDVDALSWGRVLEVGRRLVSLELDAEVDSLAHELMAIAQSNLSLEAKLGIDPGQSNIGILASGMKIVEGGMAEAAFHESADEPVLEPELSSEPESAFELELESVCEPKSASGLEVEPLSDFDFDFDFDFEPEFEPEPALELAQEPESAEEPEPVKEPEPAREPVSESELKPELVESLGSPSEPGLESGSMKQPEPGPATEPEPEPVKQPESAPEPAQEPAQGQERSSAQERRRFATFRSLYSSRDGGLCLYEDEHGHLVAVDSSKLV